MQRLFRAVKIMDPGGKWHGQIVDIRVNEGLIAEIGSDLPLNGADEIPLPQASVSTGWIDLEAIGGDPGFEHREDIASLTRAAAAGGFTKVGLRPETEPVIHDKSGVSYLLQQSRLAAVSAVWAARCASWRAAAPCTRAVSSTCRRARAPPRRAARC